MEDQQIIELYWQRSEEAIAQTARKYGRYCHTIAYNILQNQCDSDECQQANIIINRNRIRITGILCRKCCQRTTQ